MKYFKDENDNIYGFSEEDIESGSIDNKLDNLAEIDEFEKDEILTPSKEEQVKRNEEYAKIERDNAEVSTGSTYRATLWSSSTYSSWYELR